jgi:hypothetical protein
MFFWKMIIVQFCLGENDLMFRKEFGENHRWFRKEWCKIYVNLRTLPKQETHLAISICSSIKVEALGNEKCDLAATERSQQNRSVASLCHFANRSIYVLNQSVWLNKFMQYLVVHANVIICSIDCTTSKCPYSCINRHNI